MDTKPQSDYLKVRKHIIDSINGCYLLCQLEALIINDLLYSFSESIKLGKFSPVINDAILYIYEHYSKQITLHCMADNFHMNADHFGKLFKKEVKCSFNSFLTNVRMNQAEDNNDFYLI